ncbi:MAG: S8 family serine peptidase [Candidatus Marinimicrobia bacterium]|nr:S8 family serine peptidase [Candidatus Neomarinimicrobiota bacterium]
MINRPLNLLLFTIFFKSIAGMVPEQSPNTFLFCLKPEVQPLNIALSRSKITVGMAELDEFFQSNNVVKIEPWIKHATEMDRDGDIYLNRIYRVYLDGNGLGRTEQSISSIQDFPFILYAEAEYLRKPYYMPNDPRYSSQCSIGAVKADLAWDYWDIPNEFPGGKNILLASVDTGVDYTHPDLIENIWVNQGELTGNDIINDLFSIIDLNNDNLISAPEISEFMSTQSDLNGDGEINLRDALAEGSPFIDGIDNDGNGYIDDIIGWDASGEFGSEDNDPFPKTGVANGSDWAHGTHVAGILAATSDNGIGIASPVFNGSILSVKCSNDGPETDEPGIHNGYDGITYAAKAGYNAGMRTIINNSWGGDGYSSSENSVINNAFNTYGAVVVGAAGNGDEEVNDEQYAAHYPASYDNSVSVCAVDCNGDWGGWATYHNTVDLAAPGENILSTIIGTSYQSWDGSSMASPNAASVMGLLWSFYPEWTNIDIKEQILLSADSTIYDDDMNLDYIDCNGNDGEYCLGAGMVDAHKAIGKGFFPYIQTGGYEFTEIVGDGDGVINPGETGFLTISLTNQIGWADAENIEAELLTDNSGVIIHDGSAVYGNIAAGESLINTSDNYKISIASDIVLGEINFQMDVNGNSSEYNYNQKIDYTKMSVSFNQSGFPISTAEIRSSPLVIDLEGDGDKEIIFGDNNGFIHIFNSNGIEVEDDTFPYDTGSQIWGSAAAADLDGDGLTEFIITSKSKYLYIFDKNGLKTEYFAGQYLMGTPAIGNLDDDLELEVVIGGYSVPASEQKIFAVNVDGSDVTGFPRTLGEKMKAGVALSDFNGNGKDDIVVGTDDDNIYLIYDDATIALGFPYIVEDKIQTAPSIAEIDGEKVIFFGSIDNSFYAINSDGSLRFTIITGDKVETSPSFLEYNSETYIFFGSNDEKIYAVDAEGFALQGWPIEVNGNIVGSVVFSDLDGDGMAELVVATDQGELVTFHLDGSNYTYFPLSNEFPFSGSPMITDLDNDGDLEILAGSGKNLVVIDIKELGICEGYWSEFRGGISRRGSNILGGCTNLVNCNFDENAIWDDGSCAADLSEVGGSANGLDCNGDCNGVSILDCAGECGGTAILDVCGKCGGDGPAEGFDCENNPLVLEELLLPITYSISNIYPNPFNPITTIKYGIPDNGKVEIFVYDISGRQIAILMNNFQVSGFHSINWDASSYPSGLYFIRMESNNFNETRKVLLIK